MTVLPEMTVEIREGKSHGLPKPDLSAENMEKQIRQTTTINDDAKYLMWKQSTLDILKEYIPIEVTDDEIKKSVKEILGFNHWQECVIYVQKDMCSDFFNRCLSYCIDNKQKNVTDEGFIDGSGFGYLGVFNKRGSELMEKCFDEKWHNKVKRPLQKLLDQGIDIVNTANFIHPGHWSYPAGHGTKFLTVVEVLRSLFVLEKTIDRNIFIAACVMSLARSGSLIHYLMDNLAGGKLTTLVEFQ